MTTEPRPERYDVPKTLVWIEDPALMPRFKEALDRFGLICTAVAYDLESDHYFMRLRRLGELKENVVEYSTTDVLENGPVFALLTAARDAGVIHCYNLKEDLGSI